MFYENSYKWAIAQKNEDFVTELHCCIKVKEKIIKWQKRK
jgi:hypothetical protein